MADAPKTVDSLSVLRTGLEAERISQEVARSKNALDSQKGKLKKLEDELYQLTPGTQKYDSKLSEYRVQKRIVEQANVEYETKNRALSLARSESNAAKTAVSQQIKARKTQEQIASLENRIVAAKAIGNNAELSKATEELNKLKTQTPNAGDLIFRGRLDREYMGIPLSANSWDYVKSFVLNPNGASGGIIGQDGREYFIIPDAKGNISKSTIVDAESFVYNAWNAPEKIVKRYQKAMGMAVTGIPDEAYINKLTGYVSQASKINYSISLLNETDRTGRTPYTLDSLLKAVNAAGGTGTTRTSKTVTQYSDAELDAVLDEYYAKYAGKSATKQQKEIFRKAARSRAKAAPDIQTTSGDSSTYTTNIHGFGETELRGMAQKQAVKDPASEAFLNSTVYLDEFLRIVDNPVA